MALDESIQEGKDHVEEIDGVSFIYDNDVKVHVQGKIIDYHEGPEGGFSIMNEVDDPDCGSCCN